MKLNKNSIFVISVTVVLMAAIIVSAVVLFAIKGKENPITSEIEAEKITLTFETDGGTEIEPMSLSLGSAPENIQAGVKDGCIFIGWFTDENKTIKYKPGVALNEDTTLYALFIEKEDDAFTSEATEVYFDDRERTVAFILESDEIITDSNLSEFMSIEAMSGTLPPLNVIPDSGGYRIAPSEPYYTDGGLYRFILLKSGVTFRSNNRSIRQLTFRIHKDPVLNVEYSDKGFKYLSVGADGGVFNENQLLVSTALLDEKGVNVGDTICIGRGETMNLEEEGTFFLNVEKIDRLGDSCLLQVADSSLEDVVGNVDVYFENDISIADEFTAEDLSAIEDMLYDSEGTRKITYLLAAALEASPTVKSLGDGTPLIESCGTTFSDGAKIISGSKYTYEGLVEGLTVTARIGRASNENFADPKPNNWSVLDIEFHYETTLKNKVKLDATLRIAEYLNVTMQGGKRGSGKNIDYDYAINLYTQTDIIFTVLVCSVDDEDSVIDEIIDEKDDRSDKEKKLEDISVEISLIMSGEEEMDTDNIVKKMKEMLDAEGDYIELCRIPALKGSYPVTPHVPIFSVNAYLDFVVKVNFAAGISTKLSILDAKQIGIRGNTRDFTVHSYTNSLLGCERFSFDLYACGYLGIKAGLAASLTISFNNLANYGELGAEIQLGAYFDIYGYVHVHIAKTHSESTILEKSVQGGMYCEIGIYLEVNLIARSKVFRVNESVGILDFKIPLFGIGDKYVLLERDSLQTELFINKNSIHINQIPLLKGKYLDITTGETVSRELDKSKLYIAFDSRYMSFNRQTGYITVDPSKIGYYKDGPYGDGLDIGDRTFKTKMTVYFAGQTMDFGATYDSNGLTVLGVVDVTWIDESLNVSEANLGTFYTATLMIDCDGEKSEISKVMVQAGKSLGILPTWSVYELYAEDEGWDVNPNQQAIGKDTTFTYSVTKKQALVGFTYFDGNKDKWVAEIRAVNYTEAPVPPDGSENSYEGKMTFKGWLGSRGYNANRSALESSFNKMVTIPSNIFGLYSKTDVIKIDTKTPYKIVEGTKSQAAELLSEYYYKLACSYEADYALAKHEVTVLRPDDGAVYRPYSFLVNYGTTLENYEFNTISTKYEIIGWSDSDDNTVDYESPKTFPLVRSAQTYYAIYKQKECTVTVYDAFGEKTDYDVLVYESLTEDMFSGINTPEVPQGEKWVFVCFEFSRDKTLWWRTDDIYEPGIVFQSMYVRPVFDKSYQITIAAGDGVFTGENQSFTDYYRKDVHLNPLAIAGEAKKTQSDEYVYEHSGWIDTLHENKEYPLRDVPATASMNLVPKFDLKARLYELTVSCPKQLGEVVLGAKVYGTETDSLVLENLTFAELTEKKDYYSAPSHYPAPITKGEIKYSFSTPTVTENADKVSIIYSCTQAYAEHILTFSSGDGLFADGTDSKDSEPYVLRTGFYFITFQPVPVKESTLTHNFEFIGWETPSGDYYAKDGYYSGESDITLTAVYRESDRLYTLTFTTAISSFNIDGGKRSVTVDGKYNAEVKASDIPEFPAVYVSVDLTKKYTCTGWDKAIPETFTENLTLTAVWKEEPNEFKITYMLNGELYHEESLVCGDAVVELAPPSDLNGKAFSGWSWTGGTKPTVMPTRPLLVLGRTHARYVIYLVNGEESYRVRKDVGATVTPDLKPVESGYSFTDWAISGATLDNGSFVMPTSGDVTFSTEKTINSYTLSYSLNGESYKETETYDYNASVSLLPPPPKTGYAFSGWASANVTVLQGKFTMPDGNVLVTGSFVKNAHDVVYMLNGVETSREEIFYGETVTVKTEAEIQSDEEFSGWTTYDATVTNGQFDMPDNEVVFYGYITKGEYCVTYYMDAEVIAVLRAEADENVTIIPAMVKTGYRFINWTSDDVVISENAFVMPNKDVTVTGRSEAVEYALRYLDSENGSVLYETSEPYGKAIDVMGECVRRGKISTGWSLIEGKILNYEDSAESFEMPAGNVTFVAKWTPYLTVDNGYTFEKYDAQNILGFYYDEYENLITVTDSDLTLSGKTSCQIYVEAISVTFENLVAESYSEGYFFRQFKDGYCDGCKNCDYDAPIMINAEGDPTVTIKGTVSVKKRKANDEQFTAAIAVLYKNFNNLSPEEKNMIEDRTLIVTGCDGATLIVDTDGYGIYTSSKLTVSNLKLRINALESGITGTETELNGLDLIITGTPGNMGVTAFSSVTQNEYNLTVTDCSLNVKGTLSASGSIYFNGNTSGVVKAEGRAALDIIVSASFNVTGRITFETIAPEIIGSSVMLNREDSEIKFEGNNCYVSPINASIKKPNESLPIWYLGYVENETFVYAFSVTVGAPEN